MVLHFENTFLTYKDMKIGNIIIVLLFIYPILNIDVEIDKENCFIIDDNILFGNNQVFYLDTSKVKYTQFYVLLHKMLSICNFVGQKCFYVINNC